VAVFLAPLCVPRPPFLSARAGFFSWLFVGPSLVFQPFFSLKIALFFIESSKIFS
jgi:hypothetical protein